MSLNAPAVVNDHKLHAEIVSFGVAIGVGMLIGLERERRNAERGSGASAAGIRTFTLAALAGAVSAYAGGLLLLAAAVTATGVLTALGYWRTRDPGDPGITTEIALVLTTLVGGLAVTAPTIAAMVGVATAIVLAARTPLHRFVSSGLTAREVRDGLILAAATLIVLPLLPDRAFGPYDALNPRSIWLLVVLVMSIGAAGHAAIRLIGPRLGLPLAGLISGFVSSAATIAAMGARAKAAPALLAQASAAAVLSTVATVLQMTLVLAAVSLPTLEALAPSLAAAGAAALVYGVGSTVRAVRRPAPAEAAPEGAFSVLSALVFAAMVSVVMVAAAGSRALFGEQGVIVAAGLAGFADAHSAAISTASLAAAGRLAPADAVVPILTGLTSNSATKLVLAATSGSRGFLARVGPGLALVIAAAWAPVLLQAGG